MAYISCFVAGRAAGRGVTGRTWDATSPNAIHDRRRKYTRCPMFAVPRVSGGEEKTLARFVFHRLSERRGTRYERRGHIFAHGPNGRESVVNENDKNVNRNERFNVVGGTSGVSDPTNLRSS